MVNICKCIHLDRPFCVFKNKELNILQSILFAMKRKRTVSVFLVQFYHLLGIIL